MSEKRALELAREDLCFAIDVLISEYREEISSPYVWRLLGTVDFITETLSDAKEFSKIISSWEKLHGTYIRKAIKSYPNFRSKID